jgi:hypothetical protein
MARDRLTIFREIKKLEESQWRGEIEKINDGLAFPGRSDQTIKEKVVYELTLEYKRRRAWMST